MLQRMSEVALQQDFVGAFAVLERDGCLLLAANRRRLDEAAEPVRTFDLPGGRVEPGERCHEALQREWREEARVDIEVEDFLFVQEGRRLVAARARYVWRSFFFRVRCAAEPRPGAEVEGLLWQPVDRLRSVLTAPYHAGFLRWRENAEAYQVDVWGGSHDSA